MEKIIEFSKDYRSPYFKIIKDLKNNKVEEYSSSEITNYANRILDSSRNFNPKRSHTLIVRITKGFGIKVYEEKMRSDILGCIKVNGKTNQEYNGNDKVIVVNKAINKNAYLQRFILANILGYYLFGYLGGKSQLNNEYFYAEFMNQDSKMDKIANRFAMDILMPRKLFVEQYKIAVKESNSSSYFIMQYLSRYFEVPIKNVAERVKDIY